MAASQVHYVPDFDGIHALFQDPNGPCGRYLTSCGKRAEQLAKALCPVDTGRLRASINMEVDGDLVNIWASEYYAIYVEMGTRNMAAQPFLRPALISAAGSIGEFE